MSAARPRSRSAGRPAADGRAADASSGQTTNSRAAPSTASCLGSGTASALDGTCTEARSPKSESEIKLEPTTKLQLTFALNASSANIVIRLDLRVAMYLVIWNGVARTKSSLQILAR